MRIAYLVNQYPKVSHSFIRREIHALERQGVQVLRIALRGWDADVVSPEDQAERQATRYVLAGSILVLLASVGRMLLASPRRFGAAWCLALRMSRRADRSFAHHLAYLAEACRLLPWLREFDVSHVHAHFGTNSAEVAMLARELGGPPYSFTVHGPEEFDKPEFIGLGEKIRRAAFVVAISSFGRSQLYRWVAQSEWSKIHVVHCGLESSFHELSPMRFPSSPRLVCVGRLCEQKGQLLLIAAARRLMEKGVRFELVLAGDGEMRADIEAAIAKFQLTSCVRITGWVGGDQVREEILAARALVLPSFAEGLPVVLMEAMALARPVITTPVAGIPELVIGGEHGWLVPAGSVDELTAAMEDVLSRPVDELAPMGRAARVRVLERHSIDREAKKLRDLFQSYGADAMLPVGAGELSWQ